MSYFNKALCAVFSQPWLPIPDDKNIFLLGTGRASFIGELYLLFSGRKGGDQNILLTSVAFQVPLAQNNLHAKLACCGWQVLQLFQAQIFLWPIVSSTELGTQVLAHRGFGSSLSERNFYTHYKYIRFGNTSLRILTCVFTPSQEVTNLGASLRTAFCTRFWGGEGRSLGSDSLSV